MIPIVIASLWLGGLGLAPGDEPVAPVGADAPGEPAEPTPPPEPASDPLIPGAAALAALLGVLAARRRGPGDALGLQTPGDALVVFVPGHGQGPAEAVFDDLIDLMGIDDESLRFFDYRFAAGSLDPHSASSGLSISEAASSLNSYLGAVAEEGRPIYLVGFSKGGATIAHLVAGWDDGAYGPNQAVVGAALLDPPMATKGHGWLQSVGSFWGSVPDDGGYDPVECGFLWFGCEDSRDHLGEAAGVDVVVIRNPNSGITSFSDFPEGLRIYNAAGDAGSAWEGGWSDPFGLPARLAAAHEAVLEDPAVAECIVAEMWDPGACALPRHEPFRWPVWRMPVPARADYGIWPK